MAFDPIKLSRQCDSCDGVGYRMGGSPAQQIPCTTCAGTGINQPYSIANINTALDDIYDKLNDVMEKCNDIMEKLNER